MRSRLAILAGLAPVEAAIGGPVRLPAYFGGCQVWKCDPDLGNRNMRHRQMRLSNSALGQEIGVEFGFRADQRLTPESGKLSAVM